MGIVDQFLLLVNKNLAPHEFNESLAIPLRRHVWYLTGVLGKYCRLEKALNFLVPVKFCQVINNGNMVNEAPALWSELMSLLSCVVLFILLQRLMYRLTEEILCWAFTISRGSCCLSYSVHQLPGGFNWVHVILYCKKYWVIDEFTISKEFCVSAKCVDYFFDVILMCILFELQQPFYLFV